MSITLAKLHEQVQSQRETIKELQAGSTAPYVRLCRAHSYAGVSRAQVRKWVSSKLLPTFGPKGGRAKFVMKPDLDALVRGEK